MIALYIIGSLFGFAALVALGALVQAILDRRRINRWNSMSVAERLDEYARKHP